MIFCKNDSYIELFIKDPLFKITKKGKLYKLISNQWVELLPKPNEHGYRAIRYKYKKILIHRIIYRKFNGNIDSYKSINHKDGNKLNNSYNNLELISNQENQLYNYRSLNRKSKFIFYKINYKIAEKIRKEEIKEKRLRNYVRNINYLNLQFLILLIIKFGIKNWMSVRGNVALTHLDILNKNQNGKNMKNLSLFMKIHRQIK